MKERPILFSGEMVRALLDGRKTQTRRAIKPQPLGYTGRKFIVPDDSPKAWHDSDDFLSFCPYGQPGDRLWVRETWTEEHPLAIQEGRYSQSGRAGIPGPPPVSYRVIYRADGEPRQVWRNRGGHPYYTLEGPADEIAANYPTVNSNYTRGNGKGVHWNPSIHMPRWASRILLEVTAVRVERLQEISEADAIAEGLDPPEQGTWRDYSVRPEDNEGYDYCATARDSFRTLIDTINGTGTWDANPWVWVVEFKRITS